jgi:hypothetical protein
MDSFLSLPAMSTEPGLVLCNGAKGVVFVLEQPNCHDDIATVACLAHFLTRVDCPVVTLGVILDFLGHGGNKFISIVLHHGLRKVHGVLVGQGGGVCQWVVLVLSEIVEERCSSMVRVVHCCCGAIVGVDGPLFFGGVQDFV